jgi:hypothetical protein
LRRGIRVEIWGWRLHLKKRSFVADDSGQAERQETEAAMRVAQLREEKVVRSVEPPALDPRRVEALNAEEVALLLVGRFRAFSARGLHIREALVLALRPDR